MWNFVIHLTYLNSHDSNVSSLQITFSSPFAPKQFEFGMESFMIKGHIEAPFSEIHSEDGKVRIQGGIGT